MNDQNQYIAAVHDQIAKLFNDNNEDYTFDINRIDATQFFIGMTKANALIYNKLTGDDKSALEFTYLTNQLIVQDLLEKGVKPE
ncbi:hypothetical protein ACFC0X_24950 [Paenibacillus chitinolyticus]|uniref:hypothetical protein n=1 Tax=Paenibacillus chitinolyticus TaxID=79263 RepID=UPI0035DCACEF